MGTFKSISHGSAAPSSDGAVNLEAIESLMVELVRAVRDIDIKVAPAAVTVERPKPMSLWPIVLLSSLPTLALVFDIAVRLGWL